MMTAQSEMPKYQCHKQVWALKIKELIGSNDGFYIVPEDSRYASIFQPYDWCQRCSPEVGGYYVVYSDGYSSYSPAKAFEEGYTRL